MAWPLRPILDRAAPRPWDGPERAPVALSSRRCPSRRHRPRRRRGPAPPEPADPTGQEGLGGPRTERRRPVGPVDRIPAVEHLDGPFAGDVGAVEVDASGGQPRRRLHQPGHDHRQVLVDPVRGELGVDGAGTFDGARRPSGAATSRGSGVGSTPPRSDPRSGTASRSGVRTGNVERGPGRSPVAEPPGQGVRCPAPARKGIGGLRPPERPRSSPRLEDPSVDSSQVLDQAPQVPARHDGNAARSVMTSSVTRAESVRRRSVPTGTGFAGSPGRSFRLGVSDRGSPSTPAACS